MFTDAFQVRRERLVRRRQLEVDIEQIVARDAPRRATMSGFGERMQRAARERIEASRRDASAAPAFAARVRLPAPGARARGERHGALGVPDAKFAWSLIGLRLLGEFACGQTSDCAPPAGMGVRRRIAGVGVKVYACGLYVHPKQARTRSGRARRPRRPPRSTRRRRAARRASRIRALDVRQNLDSAKIADALSERLRPALGKDSKSLRTFETYFDGVTFLKGQSLTFSADGGKLTTSIRGKRVGVIDDAEMCVALFDAYLGKNPVVPGAKKSLGEKLAAHVVG